MSGKERDSEAANGIVMLYAQQEMKNRKKKKHFRDK